MANSNAIEKSAPVWPSFATSSRPIKTTVRSARDSCPKRIEFVSGRFGWLRVSGSDFIGTCWTISGLLSRLAGLGRIRRTVPWSRRSTRQATRVTSSMVEVNTRFTISKMSATVTCGLPPSSFSIARMSRWRSARDGDGTVRPSKEVCFAHAACLRSFTLSQRIEIRPVPSSILARCSPNWTTDLTLDNLVCMALLDVFSL